MKNNILPLEVEHNNKNSNIHTLTSSVIIPDLLQIINTSVGDLEQNNIYHTKDNCKDLA